MGADKFSIRGVAVDLELAEKFTIAVESWDVANNVFAIVSYGDHSGVGEVSPDARWGDSADSVLAEINAVDLNQLDITVRSRGSVTTHAGHRGPLRG